VRYGELGPGRHGALPGLTEGAEPAWHLYVIRHPQRERIAHALAHAGVQSRVYYGTPVHRQRAMRPYAPDADAALPVSDELARSHLAIPIGPTLTTEQLAHVTETVAAALAGRGPIRGRTRS
jgi:dTDP-3-amino-3,4,6-trideoxy-alpha-D-glucose transaminase